MASTCSNAPTRLVAGSAPAETPPAALLTLVRRGVRIQIAACTAAAKTLAEWAQGVDRLAQSVGDELLRRLDAETDSAELAARLTAASSTHFSELAALPRAAVNHFDTRLARVRIDN
jgi:hypothetical protein